jgi:hypothetical protein
MDSCQQARAKALSLKSVPVIFPTIADFDKAHLGVAQSTIERARSTN